YSLATSYYSYCHLLNLSSFPTRRSSDLWLDRLFDEMGCVDAFREINKQSSQFTWWPEQTEGSRKKAGIRVDYHLLTPGIRKAIRDGWIDDDTRFSDHAPVIMDYDIEIGI